MNVRDLGEFGLIDQLSTRLTVRDGVTLGIGDDAALLNALDTPVVTTDALVENVHFRRDWIGRFSSPRALGRKAMAVNVSDLAAMGARPVAAFVALAFPKDEDAAWLEELYAGFEDAARAYQFTIAGGDTVAAPLLMLSITLIGELLPEARQRAVLRSGVQAGDALCVSGTLGDSGGGLALLLDEALGATPAPRAALLRRHFEPTPRLEMMRTLLRTNRAAIHAAMDLSDGLRGDARHLARRSGVKLEIHAENLPLSEAAREVAAQNGLDPLDWALAGGEDYELLLAIAPDAVADLNVALEAAGHPRLTVVGEVGAGPPEVVVLENGVLRAGSGAWTHF